MKRKIIIFGIAFLCLTLVIAENILDTKEAMWKIPTEEKYSTINEKDYVAFIKDTYGDDIKTSNINYYPEMELWNFTLNYKNGTAFYRIKFSIDDDFTTEQIQEKAEYWSNYWMIKEFEKSKIKQDIGGLRF